MVLGDACDFFSQEGVTALKTVDYDIRLSLVHVHTNADNRTIWELSGVTDPASHADSIILELDGSFCLKALGVYLQLDDGVCGADESLVVREQFKGDPVVVLAEASVEVDDRDH